MPCRGRDISCKGEDGCKDANSIYGPCVRKGGCKLKFDGQNLLFDVKHGEKRMIQVL